MSEVIAPYVLDLDPSEAASPADWFTPGGAVAPFVDPATGKYAFRGVAPAAPAIGDVLLATPVSNRPLVAGNRYHMVVDFVPINVVGNREVVLLDPANVLVLANILLVSSGLHSATFIAPAGVGRVKLAVRALATTAFPDQGIAACSIRQQPIT